MSETAAAPEMPKPSLETVIIALICVVALAAGWYVLSQQQQSLRRSPSGLDGLQAWLSSNGVGAQSFAGGWLMDQTGVGLLIVPLYDTDLDTARTHAASEEDLLRQQDEYDLQRNIIAQKAAKVPVMIVLPKWRSGMRLTGLAHPDLLVEAQRVAATLGKMFGGIDLDRTHAAVPFTEFAYRSTEDEELRARVYAAQTLRGEGCRPVIGTREAMLLADCPFLWTDDGEVTRVLVLADPDLVNNHGLRLGDNARIALDLLKSRAGERNVVIDYSSDDWLRDPVTAPPRERSWDDLARFFGPPFLTLWAGAAIVLALFVWRGALRGGPVRPDDGSPNAGKMVAVRARARLMRLSGQDGALIRDYAAARLAATASSLFGPAQARHFSGEDSFLDYAARRHPAEAPRLRAVLDDIRGLPARLPAAEGIHHIDRLEQVLELITHDA
jgi:hypothetical protein